MLAAQYIRIKSRFPFAHRKKNSVIYGAGGCIKNQYAESYFNGDLCARWAEREH